MKMLVPLLLACALLCTPSSSQMDGADDRDRIEALMQKVEYHRSGLKESLDKLTSSLASLKDSHSLNTYARHRTDSPKTHERHRRDSLAALTSSYLSFCHTLLNPSGHSVTEPRKTGKSKKASQDLNKMITPKSTVTPVAVSVDSDNVKNTTIVRFKVEHTQPGVVSLVQVRRSLPIGGNKRKRLRVNPNDKLPKTSNVVFRLTTPWCNLIEEPAIVFFHFSSRSPNEVGSSVGLHICNSTHTEKDMSSDTFNRRRGRCSREPARATLPLPPQYNSSSPDFVVEKGKDISVVFEISERTINSLQDGITDFSLQGTAFRSKTGASFCNVHISKSHSEDRIFDIGKPRPFNSDLPLNDLVTINEISAPPMSRFLSIPSKPSVSHLNITFNTSPGDTSFLWTLFITNSYESGIIKYSQIEVPFEINRANERSPFPEDFIVPLHETTQTCDLNKNGRMHRYNLGYCAVGCSVVGDPISSITIEKIGGPKTQASAQQTTISSYWGTAVLQLGQGHPDMSGKYLCQTTSKSGKKTDWQIAFLAHKSVTVNRDVSLASAAGNSTVMTCSAEGTGVQLQIDYTYFDKEEMFTERVDTKPAFQKTVQVAEKDRRMFTLTVPNDYLATSTGSFVCNASNSYEYDATFYDISHVSLRLVSAASPGDGK